MARVESAAFVVGPGDPTYFREKSGLATILTFNPPSIDLAAATAWLRIDHNDDDAAITDLISEAYSEVECRTGRLLREATAELTLDSLPTGRQPIALPFAPLRSLTRFDYFDASGVADSLAPHSCVNHAPGLLLPPTGEVGPRTETDNAAAVTIRFECGAEPI